MSQTYARQAIRTRYLGPSNFRGSRVVAECEAGRLTLSWDNALNAWENHRAAYEALRDRLGWVPPYYTDSVAGVFKGDHYWVSLPREATEGA